MNKPDKYVYLATFETAVEGGYTVTFKDLPGCITEGDTMEEAIDMAKESLELFLWNLEDEKEEIPVPSKPQDIKLDKDCFLVGIDAYMPLIRAEMSNKAVKKTLTIPSWLNKIAEEKKVNFSLVLQNALKQHLGIKDNK